MCFSRTNIAMIALCMSLVGCGGHSPPLRSASETPTQSKSACPAMGRVSPVKVQYFGVSTLLLQDEGCAILIDGFFSRPSIAHLLFSTLKPIKAELDYAFNKTNIKRIGAVLVAHSHYDHAMDSAAVAARTDAILIGSSSTLMVAEGQGYAVAGTQLLRDRQAFRVGEFEITPIKTEHSPLSAFVGEVGPGFRREPRVWDFESNLNFSFWIRHPSANILVVPSANLMGESLKGVTADVVFLSVGALGLESEEFVQRMWAETVVATGANLVVPIHWDDFTKSLDRPLEPLPRLADNLPLTLDRIERLQRSSPRPVNVRYMQAFSTIDTPFERWSSSERPDK